MYYKLKILKYGIRSFVITCNWRISGIFRKQNLQWRW